MAHFAENGFVKIIFKDHFIKFDVITLLKVPMTFSPIASKPPRPVGGSQKG
jgi:hypothetical protein